MKFHQLLIPLICAMCAAASPVWGAPIPGLFNTGVDNAGVNLPLGAVDPHYTITAAPSGLGPNAFVQGLRPPAWVSDTSDSRWIGPQFDANQFVFDPPGTYRYDLSFDLSAFDESSVVVSGAWSADNSSQIRLNGVPMATHIGGTGAFLSFDSFSFNSGFVPGINLLSFLVGNNGSSNGLGTPTGLHVDNLTGTGDPRICNLTNPGFDRSEPTGAGPPASFGDWKGDDSHITPFGPGITPHSGFQMLQFDGTSPSGGSAIGLASEVWQLVDVSHLATEIAAGKLYADFEYFANRVFEAPDALPMVDTLFTARLQANSGSEANFPANINNFLALSTSQLISDNDPTTWQRISTSMQVPIGTTYLAVRVAAEENIFNDATNEFAGHFADSACVHLRVVPEPSSFLLAGVAAFAALLLLRRST